MGLFFCFLAWPITVFTIDRTRSFFCSFLFCTRFSLRRVVDFLFVLFSWKKVLHTVDNSWYILISLACVLCTIESECHRNVAIFTKKITQRLKRNSNPYPDRLSPVGVDHCLLSIGNSFTLGATWLWCTKPYHRVSHTTTHQSLPSTTPQIIAFVVLF